MQDLEDRLKELGDSISRQAPSELRPTARSVRRIRVGRAVRSGAVLAMVAALVIGVFAGARSLSSDQAIPPANPRPEEIFADVSGWITYGDNAGLWARDLASPGDPADKVRLSSTPGSPIEWSPDGSKLLVVRDVPPSDPSAPFSSDLFVVDSDGTETRLTDANGSINGSSFSPDGTEVVYAKGSAIYVVDAEGGTPRLLYSAGERLFDDSRCPQFKGCVGEQRPVVTSLQTPTYSPDGTQIAYFDGNGDSGHSLRVINNDGTNMRVVVENSETLGAGHVYGLQWSPDGSQLAFSIESRLYVVREDGSGFRLVANDAVEPYWSPDDSYIAYTRGDPQTSEGGSLEIVRLDDLQVQNFGDGGSGPWTAEMER